MNKTKDLNILVIPAWYDASNPLLAGFIHEYCNAISSYCNLTVLDVKWHSFSKRFKKNNNKDVLKNKRYKVLKIDYYNRLPGAWRGANFKIQRNRILQMAKNKVKSFEKINGKFDLIHIQSVCNNITPIIAKVLSNTLQIPYIITEHYSDYEGDMKKIYQPYANIEEVREIVKNARYRFGVSSFINNHYKTFFNADFIVMPNLINKMFESPLPATIKIPSKEIIFLCIGRLSHKKGQVNLVQAFANLHKKHLNVCLKLIGEGDRKDEIFQLVEKEKISVIIETWKSKEELMEEIDKADVIVSSSTIETFGLTMVEGFFRGKPAVATDSGGPKDFITKKNGILVENSNIESLEKGMERMVTEFSTYSSIIIRKDAINLYSEKAICDRMMVYYKNTISNLRNEINCI